MRKRTFGTVFKRGSAGGKRGRKGHRAEWVARYFVEGRRVERHFETRDLADKWLHRAGDVLARSGVLGIRPIRDVSVDEFIEDFTRHIERAHRRTTVEGERPRLHLLAEFWKGRLVSELTEGDVALFLDHVAARRKTAISPATHNRYVALLSKLFQRAVLLGAARQNPMKTGAFKRRREREVDVPFLEPGAQEQLVAAQPGSTRALVLLALDSGLRRSELLRLEWPEVDFDRSTVRVRESKNGDPREVRLTARAIACMRSRNEQRAIRPLHGPDRVFPEWPPPESETFEDRRRLLRAFRVGCRAAGLARDIRFHDLRHLFAVNLVRAGVPLPDVSRLLGHRSKVMVLRYAKHAPADSAARAVERLERYLAAPTSNREIGAG